MYGVTQKLTLLTENKAIPLICNQQVAGSSPIASSKGAKIEKIRTYFFDKNVH